MTKTSLHKVQLVRVQLSYKSHQLGSRFSAHYYEYGEERRKEWPVAIAKMKNAGKGSKSNGKSGQEIKRDRKSGTGMNGSPKKGGHGGKFTWAGVGYSDAELGQSHEVAIDVKDPNYEDPVKIDEA